MIKLVNKVGAQWRLPPTVLFKRVPFTVIVPHQAIPGGDGAVKTGRATVQPRQFVLEGRIYYPGRKDRIRQELDGLLPFLMQPPIEVHHHGRFLRAHPLGAPQDWIDEGAELGLQLPMVALDPYWYGAEVVVTETDADEWAVEVDGSAGALPVIRIEFAASGSDAIIRNDENGLYVHVVGPFSEGDVVTIDTAAFTATIQNGGLESPIIDRLGDEFVAHGFELVPGSNALQYTGPTADVMITYRPRWY